MELCRGYARKLAWQSAEEQGIRDQVTEEIIENVVRRMFHEPIQPYKEEEGMVYKQNTRIVEEIVAKKSGLRLNDRVAPERPVPRDMSLPPGFKRRLSGMIEPEGFGTVCEGQQHDETKEDYEYRKEMEHLKGQQKIWSFIFMLSALLVLVINISVAIFEPGLPIGLIPVPVLGVSMFMRNKYGDKISKLEMKDRVRISWDDMM